MATLSEPQIFALTATAALTLAGTLFFLFQHWFGWEGQ